jgi:hypothetical protein
MHNIGVGRAIHRLTGMFLTGVVSYDAYDDIYVRNQRNLSNGISTFGFDVIHSFTIGALIGITWPIWILPYGIRQYDIYTSYNHKN